MQQQPSRVYSHGFVFEHLLLLPSGVFLAQLRIYLGQLQRASCKTVLFVGRGRRFRWSVGQALRGPSTAAPARSALSRPSPAPSHISPAPP
jgi:hypothetical protein